MAGGNRVTLLISEFPNSLRFFAVEENPLFSSLTEILTPVIMSLSNYPIILSVETVASSPGVIFVSSTFITGRFYCSTKFSALDILTLWLFPHSGLSGTIKSSFRNYSIQPLTLN